MTKEELSNVIFDAWSGDKPRCGLSDFSDKPAAEGMVRSLCDAVAEALVQSVASGVTIATPVWQQDNFTTLASVFSLTYPPMVGSVLVYRNGQLESGWTLALTVLTLAAPLAGSDSLDVWYQRSA